MHIHSRTFIHTNPTGMVLTIIHWFIFINQPTIHIECCIMAKHATSCKIGGIICNHATIHSETRR